MTPDEVEAVLTEHAECGIVNVDAGSPIRFTCGGAVPRPGPDSTIGWVQLHRRHVADALAHPVEDVDLSEATIRTGDTLVIQSEITYPADGAEPTARVVSSKIQRAPGPPLTDRETWWNTQPCRDLGGAPHRIPTDADPDLRRCAGCDRTATMMKHGR